MPAAKNQEPMKRLILVVDDEPVIQRVIDIILQLSGFDCHTAANGHQALEKLQSNPYEIVITDVNMPGMDGMELLKEVRRNYPNTDVLVISGFLEAEDGAALLQAGASDFLAKPFNAYELTDKITRILGKQHARPTASRRGKMAANEFRIYMVRADTLRSIAMDLAGVDFWTGYLRGLSQHYHGEKSSSAEEHQQWFEIADHDADLQRRAKGQGYRAGFAGLDPLEVFHARKQGGGQLDALQSPSWRRGN